jgi:activator of HSP90 ATPase
MNMKDFKKYYLISAPPEDVYLALTFAPTIMLWTGDRAEMEAEAGTEFSLWGGDIVGRNLEFETNKKIVQQWYFGDQPDDSIVTIKLHKDPKGTSVELKHTNIPDEEFANIADGWDEVYFQSLKEFYEE